MNRLLGMVIVLFLSCSTMTSGYAQPLGKNGYFSFVDEHGQVVYKTGWEVQVGDQCVTEANQRFEVVGVEGETAHVKLISHVDLSQYGNANAMFTMNILHPAVARAEGKPKVAIYHTHSDESYVPTDGKESILGSGGIYKVGDAFANALQANGVEVIRSPAKHDPHDNMAYERSRRTAADLLKQQPDAIFDVHRDSTPPEVYKTVINGQDITKVQLVVGKYGPTGKQIEDYALQIKAAADQQHPGLVKGIFFAKGGDYNQDLFPRSMLVEVGSHTNDRPAAERGIALFADVVPSVLGKTAASSQNTDGKMGLGTTETGPSGASKAMGWIIGALIIGVAAFMFLSTGSMQEAKAKLKQFAKTEFANFFGPLKRRKVDKKDVEKQIMKKIKNSIDVGELISHNIR